MSRLSTATAAVMLMVLLLAITTASAGGPITHKPKRDYRCFRPFDALSSFTPKDMQHRDNCVFEYLRVDGANASVYCGVNAPKGLDNEACYVDLRMNLTALKALGDDTMPRYSLELRALNNSVVNYKGMDGNGYSVCCALLGGEPCRWMGEQEAKRRLVQPDPEMLGLEEQEGMEGMAAAGQQQDEAVEQSPEPEAKDGQIEGDRPQGGGRQVHVPLRCPLVEGPQLGELNKAMTGALMKPLHRPIAGAWEAKITFRNGKDRVVGQLKIPFALQKKHLSDLLDGMTRDLMREGKASKELEAELAMSNTAVAVVQNETNAGQAAGEL